MSAFINLDQKNILVVEDDDMNFVYLNQIFKLTKGNITRAKNGTQALEFAKNNSYDLILMDIQLPDISGTEVTKQIRKFDRKTPIVAQTASRTPDETDDCFEVGCNDLLVKPFKYEDLARVLSAILA